LKEVLLEALRSQAWKRDVKKKKGGRLPVYNGGEGKRGKRENTRSRIL